MIFSACSTLYLLNVHDAYSSLSFRAIARDKNGREIYNELCVDGQERPQTAV
jgi:hypothetical protein